MRVDEWLADFEVALSAADAEGLASIFHADSYWRDVLAFTWLITTVRGAENVAAALTSSAPLSRSGNSARRSTCTEAEPT